IYPLLYGGESIFGKYFQDENFLLKHDKKYIVGMANKGPDSNASQFYITLRDRMQELDGKSVVFGEVYEGTQVIDEIAKRAKPGHPTPRIKVRNCGLSYAHDKDMICMEPEIVPKDFVLDEYLQKNGFEPHKTFVD
ncbi:hypothetical protein AAMO2058_000482800, partial [Amorphochlora amoebiformis]